MTPPPVDTIILELKPVKDPLTERGLPPRDPMIRLRHILKRVLRSEGFVCIRVMDGRSPHGPPCPRCAKPLDDLGRCWTCFDWRCVCGGLTGSALFSTCHACTLVETDHE